MYSDEVETNMRMEDSLILENLRRRYDEVVLENVQLTEEVRRLRYLLNSRNDDEQRISSSRGNPSH